MRTIIRATLATLGCLVVVSVAGASGVVSTDPSFAPGPSLPAGTSPGAVAVADFDGNGSADLAIADSGYEQNLRILLNDAAGHFRVAPGSPSNIGSGPLASADFNRDGRADLAVADAQLKILLGDGSGRFTQAPGSPIALEGDAVYSGDLNRDGAPDLVVAVSQQNGDHKLKVLLNDGTGRFTVLRAIPPVTVKGDFFSCALADLSGDGNLDLAVADGKSGKLAVLLGDGTGGLGPATRFRAGQNAGKLVVGDFNGDGKPDLAEPVSYGSKIAVLPGTGGGRFASPLLMKAGAYDLAVADFDRDGKSDLAAVSETAIDVLLGTASGRLREAKRSPFDAGWLNLVATADFDGDSKTDILSLAGTGVWWPAQRGNLILFQTHSSPEVERGRSLLGRVDSVFATHKPIESLAADGYQAAACLNASYRHSGFVVWTAPGKKSLTLRASCGDGDFALAHGRIAWIVEYALPNQPELKILVYEERLSDGRRGVIGGVENESNHNDLRGDWLSQVMGSGSLLAWNTWYLDCLSPPPPLCEGDYCEECDSDNPTLRISGQELVITHGRFSRARHGFGLYPLRAVGGGRLAATPAGAVVVLAPNGSRVASVPAIETDPPREIALSRTRLAVERTSTLDVYNPATGAQLGSFPLGPSAAMKLVGVASEIALLRGPHELVLVRLSDGKLVSLPLPAAAARGLVDAKLTSAGLFYAYDLPRGGKRGRIIFEPAAKLLARF
jgi:FG-GAP-like repeat